MAKTLYFLVNLDLSDGSAHALYCTRNVISLAKNAPPDWNVVLLHASGTSKQTILSLHGSPDVSRLQTIGLPSLRRRKWVPFHLNAIFHMAISSYLRRHVSPGDIVCTASFPELFRFIVGKLTGCGVRFVYEVHQLEMQSRSKDHPKCAREFEALGQADSFITTCCPLREILRENFPKTECHNLGLASTYASICPAPPAGGTFKIGYFGSLSSEQGVPWLVGEWGKIRALCDSNVELYIYGRARRNEMTVPSDPLNGIYSFDPIPSNSVPAACEKLNALIIPALDQAHRASIAFTKAYDYAGIGLPVLSSDLPTIREVLAPEIHALYFAPGCAQALAERINRLSQDASLAATIACNLRHRAAEFSWDNRARRWWEAVLS